MKITYTQKLEKIEIFTLLVNFFNPFIILKLLSASLDIKKIFVNFLKKFQKSQFFLVGSELDTFLKKQTPLVKKTPKFVQKTPFFGIK